MQARSNPQWNMAALVRRVQPQAGELASARLHRAAVRARLAASFDVSRVLAIGSHARDTAIRSYSDLDMLVVLRRNEAKWGGNIVSSRTVLGRVQDDLRARFTRTDIRRDQQAAVVGFAAGQQSLDVVPAIFRRFGAGRPIFAIPDGNGDWLETSPEAHNQYFSAADKLSGGKLKRVVQLLKWWKCSRAQPIPIQTFHIDLLMATSKTCIGVKPYTHCLYQAFQLLNERECRGLRDPLGIAGVIYAAKTDPQWNAICAAVAAALDRSRAAVEAEARKDFEEANRQWNILFNGQF